jgi:terminase large subunit-like protein
MANTARLDRLALIFSARGQGEGRDVRLDRVDFARAAGLDPDPWQVEVLQSDAGRILLNCRQSGKSSIVAILAAYAATYFAGSTTLIISPGERQSGLVLQKVRDALDRVGWPTLPRRESMTHIELANGGRVVALPASTKGTTRGYTANLLLVDEAAHVPDSVMLDMAPVLAVTGGRIIALSTPYGSRGWWWQAWCDRERDGWQYFEIPASLCPRISADFLAEERRSRGSWHYEQEYCCRFKEASGALFREEDIQALFHPELEAWDILS